MEKARLFDLLLKVQELRAVEELGQGDFRPAANILDGHDRRAVVPPADNVIQVGLHDPADGGKAVDGDVGYCEGGPPFNLGYADMNRITKIRVFGLKDGIIFNNRFFMD